MVHLRDLRQRKLVQWALAYLAGAWLLYQALSLVGQNFDWPPFVLRGATVLIVAGFAVVLVLAWYHGERGYQRASSVEILMLAALLVLAGTALWWVRGDDSAAVSGERARPGPPPSASAGTRPGPIDERSIAVLPFVNLSPDPDDEYFSDGMTEEILTTLAKIEWLRVISRTSIMRYENTTKSVPEIGVELGVATVLEGSVRRQADRVRIAVQLVDARTDEHLWAETYDRELTDIFAIQSDVATRIADALQTRISASDRTRLSAVPTDDIEAYQLYLQGRHFWNQRTANALRKAIELFRQAIDRDPDFALAHAGIAAAYVNLGDYRYVPGSEAYPVARESARRSLEIDPELADAHAVLGAVLEAELDWDAAEEEYRQAIASNPNHATAHHWYGLLLESMGRLDEALAEGRLALSLDPLSPPINTSFGKLLFDTRDYPAAIDQLEKTREIAGPDYPWVLPPLGLAYSAVGRHTDAIAMHRRGLALVPNDPTALADFGAVLARAGQAEEAREILDRLTVMAGTTSDRGPSRGTGPAFAVARVYSALGDVEQALQWLARADRNAETLAYLRYDPFLDPLRSDPRFRRLLREAAAS